MPRISLDHLAAAIGKVRAMSLKQKESLADEIYAQQRNLMASVLALPGLGVSHAKLEFALEMLLICYQAMKETGLRWAFISEDDQEYEMDRNAALIKHQERMDPQLGAQFARNHIERFPEPLLLAFVSNETSAWLEGVKTRGMQEESDKYLMLATTNLVNCIAYAKVLEPVASVAE